MKDRILKQIKDSEKNLETIETALKNDDWNGDKYFTGMLKQHKFIQKSKIKIRKAEVKIIDKTNELTQKVKNYINK